MFDSGHLFIGAELTQFENLAAIFERSVRLHGDREALCGSHGSLTYTELGRRSDSLARALRERGIGCGSRVGLLLDRSVEFVVSILGVLKAGAAYVPLDPQYPAERLTFLAADAGCVAIIAHDDMFVSSGLGCDATVVSPASVGAETTPLSSPSPRDAAYVLYTSGSTGRPKGVEIAHRDVVALLSSALGLFDFTPNDRWALVHSFSFDVSVWELWSCFASGATACVAQANDTKNFYSTVEFLIERKISVLHQVPSVFRYVVLAHEKLGAPTLPLRHLIFAGESIDLTSIRRFKAENAMPQLHIANMYGLTETTIYSTYKSIEDADLAAGVQSPIGKALAHQSLSIRDDHGRKVQPGSVGELWIGRNSVAEGYLNCPEITKKRFVLRPGSNGPVRYYRTGDLARQLADGNFEYLGRNDEQVKIRGFRIELGEIEAALRANDYLDDAAVLVESRFAGEPALVAYVVPREGAPLRTKSLSSFVRSKLPRHMVPSRFETITVMPLTVSGKIDRQILSSGGFNSRASTA